MKLKHLVWLWAAILCSCTSNTHPSPNTIPAVGNNIAQTKAHISSADRLVTEAKKDTGKTGIVLLTAAHAELGDAAATNTKAASELQTVQKECDNRQVEIEKRDNRILIDENGWGYKLQTFIEKVIFWIKTVFISLVVIHFAGLIGSLLVTGPLGPILGKIGTVVNPFAWLQAIVSRIHINRIKEKDSK